MQRELEKTILEQSRYVGLDEPDDQDSGDDAPTPSPTPSKKKAAVNLPLLGEIAAGRPLEAIEECEVVDLADVCRAHEANYMLRVRGDSMIDDGICDGDYVLVEKRNNARDGETVVAVLENNEATLKRFYRMKKKFKLQPANATLKPLVVDKLEIRGVVVGVLRSY